MVTGRASSLGPAPEVPVSVPAEPLPPAASEVPPVPAGLG